nr:MULTISPECIES: glutaminyl-peptide cyclotransferase [Myxococcaceae]
MLTLAACGRTAAPAAPGPAPVAGYRVVNSFPHDPQAFTEGLVYRNGHLYESTGLEGRSSVREVTLETGVIVRRHNLDPQYFGEGLALMSGRLFQLTWKTQQGFLYDAASLQPAGGFTYAGEGWGLTDDGTSLIQSNGTATLRFLDPVSFAVQRELVVKDAGREVKDLNELEYIKGELWANVWLTERIARIDPASGQVKGWVDLKGLPLVEHRTGNEDVHNGIAYDAAADRILVTGKYWARIYEIQVVPR